MKVEVNGVQITLTQEQLEQISSQIPYSKSDAENWKDKIFNSKYRLYVNGGNNIIPYKLTVPISNNEFSFKNQEQAQLMAKKCNLMIEMHNFAHIMNKGWIPDWKDDSDKFGIWLNGGFQLVPIGLIYNDFVFGIVVKSDDIAKLMLQEFGDRIKEIYNTQY